MILGERPWAERLYIVAVPLILYAILVARVGPTTARSFTVDDIPGAPRYVLDAMAGGMGTLLGGSPHPATWSPEAVGQEWILPSWSERSAWRLARHSPGSIRATSGRCSRLGWSSGGALRSTSISEGPRNGRY